MYVTCLSIMDMWNFVLYFFDWTWHVKWVYLSYSLSSSICKVNYLALQRMENSMVLVCATKNPPYLLKPHLSQMMISFLHHLHLVRSNPFRSVTPSLFRPRVYFCLFFFLIPYATFVFVHCRTEEPFWNGYVWCSEKS